MTVYLCQDNFDSILCGVYDAWMSRRGHDHVRLELEGQGNMEMFCQYEQVVTDPDKLDKVITSIRRKTSQAVLEQVFNASLSAKEGKADIIYRFLICAFHYGGGVIDMLWIPAVYEVFQQCRYVWNEQHKLLGFVRFSKTKQGLLSGKIGPVNDVLVLLAPHFADRLPSENWILYDEKRKKAAVHRADSGWALVEAESASWEGQLGQETDENEYQDLWNAFFHSVAIKERTNPRCQRNFLPLRYRDYMTEFRKP